MELLTLFQNGINNDKVNQLKKHLSELHVESDDVLFAYLFFQEMLFMIRNNVRIQYDYLYQKVQI